MKITEEQQCFSQIGDTFPCRVPNYRSSYPKKNLHVIYQYVSREQCPIWLCHECSLRSERERGGRQQTIDREKPDGAGEIFSIPTNAWLLFTLYAMPYPD